MDTGSPILTEVREDATIKDSGLPVENRSLFLDLPTELRLNVYSHLWEQHTKKHLMVFHQDRAEMSWKLVTHPWSDPTSRFTSALSLLQTCKQVRGEVQEYIYGRVDFEIYVLNYTTIDIQLEPERFTNFLRFARNVELLVVWHTEEFMEIGVARLHLDGLRALMEAISLSQRLRKFSISLRLSARPSTRQSVQERRTVDAFLDVTDWFDSGEDVPLVQDNGNHTSYDTVEGKDLAHGWALLSKLEALWAKLANETGDGINGG